MNRSGSRSVIPIAGRGTRQPSAPPETFPWGAGRGRAGLAGGEGDARVIWRGGSCSYRLSHVPVEWRGWPGCVGGCPWPPLPLPTRCVLATWSLQLREGGASWDFRGVAAVGGWEAGAGGIEPCSMGLSRPRCEQQTGPGHAPGGSEPWDGAHGRVSGLAVSAQGPGTLSSLPVVPRGWDPARGWQGLTAPRRRKRGQRGVNVPGGETGRVTGPFPARCRAVEGGRGQVPAAPCTQRGPSCSPRSPCSPSRHLPCGAQRSL